jgi:hypothetical protein
MTMQQTQPSLMSSSMKSESNEPNQIERNKKADAAIVAWLEGEFRKAKDARTKDEKQWFVNLAFYFGKQNIAIMTAPGTANFKLYTPPAPYYRSRPVINRIRPLIRTEVSKLTSQKPSAFVVPASSEDRDLYAANAGEQIWDSIYHSKKLHRILRRAVWWASTTGNGFIKCWWDDDKVDEATGVVGDICYEQISPFHIFVPNLKLQDIEDQPMVMHAVNHDIEALEMAYGVKIEHAKDQSEVLNESFQTAMGIDTNVAKKQDKVVVIEAWIKPNKYKKFPNGALLTVAGSQILNLVEGWPYEHKQYPFIHIQHIETGKFYGESTITDLIPLQREYNRTRGQIIESKNKMSKPQLAAEQGSIDASKVTSEPGQIIFYRPGFQAPQPIPLQSLPSYVLEEQDRIKMDMDEISGQHEVSRGQAPAGVTAATAIAYLQEQDDTKLSGTYDNIEEGMEKLAHQTLVFVKQFWDTPRMIKTTGQDQSFDVLTFQGSDLRDNTDIRMEAGSALPTSRAAKQAFVMDLMKMGFIDPNKGLEVMEIGGINKIYEQVQVDIRQAQRENLRMSQVTVELLMQHEQAEMMKLEEDPDFQLKMQNQMIMQNPQTGELIDISPTLMGGMPVPVEPPLIVPVNSWDDHRLHIEQHNKYRKSQAFENLPPEAKELFEAHVNKHVQAIMVGAQGAMGMDPAALEMANNPETISELTYREQAEQPGAGPTQMSQQDPSMGMEQM